MDINFRHISSDGEIVITRCASDQYVMMMMIREALIREASITITYSDGSSSIFNPKEEAT